MTCRYYPQVLAERFSEHRFREDTAAMSQMPILITLPPETTCLCPDTTTVRIMRGVGAVIPLDAASAGPWEVWDAVARARLHAVTAAHVPARARRNCGAWWSTWVPASFPAGVPAVGAVPREAFRSCVSVSPMPTPSRRVIVPAGYRQTN